MCTCRLLSKETSNTSTQSVKMCDEGGEPEAVAGCRASQQLLVVGGGHAHSLLLPPIVRAIPALSGGREVGGESNLVGGEAMRGGVSQHI